ncbi:MAG: flavin reductase family protein [Methanomassiliicoccales archaeon]|nr:MAG: flavin reductase family protein [Methanomassiliicoccales archaeon]
MKRSIGARTLLYPTPVMVVGTYDREGRPNAMVVAWGGICCSVPPCVAISLRKATYTYSNLMEGMAFTVSIPSDEHVEEVDYLGIASGRDTDKFEDTGLTPERAERVNAPFVREFPVVLECKVVGIHELGLHTQFIGEIVDVKVEDDCLIDGSPVIEKIRPLIYSPGSSSYFNIGEELMKAFTCGRKFMKK